MGRGPAIGGEVPGPLCVRADECPPDSGGNCDPATGTLSFCLHGERRELDCVDYGYAGCAEEWNRGCRP